MRAGDKDVALGITQGMGTRDRAQGKDWDASSQDAAKQSVTFWGDFPFLMSLFWGDFPFLTSLFWAVLHFSTHRGFNFVLSATSEATQEKAKIIPKNILISPFISPFFSP